MNKEYILSSAIWFDDDKQYYHQPKNITTGFVVCGRRHHNCFATLSSITKDDDTKIQAHLLYEKEQGFLTNTDRFVDREEGGKIAFNAGQTTELKKNVI